jgi:MazG family protein
MGPSPNLAAAVDRLSDLISGLLHPEKGCPWDLAQTYKSISEDFLEETYELREALLSSANPEAIKEEAGDLAFLIFFLGRLTEKPLGFGLTEMIDGAVDKMVYRHPHVFDSSLTFKTPEEVLKNWHALKRAKKKAEGLLSSVPTALPALARAQRLGSKAARSGFDFQDFRQVREKLTEELGELDQELAEGNFTDPKRAQALSHEIGDLLATVVNLARHLNLSAEKSLAQHNRRFMDRISKMEAQLAKSSRSFEDADMDELEELWQKSKDPL